MNAMAVQTKTMPCPKCGNPLAESRLNGSIYSNYECLCGYEGDGTLPTVATEDLGWESIQQQHKELLTATIYRQIGEWCGWPNIAQHTFQFVVEETSAALRKKGRPWRLLGVFGLMELPSQYTGLKHVTRQRSEIRRAAQAAICMALHAKPEDVIGLKSIVNYATQESPKDVRERWN